MQQTLLLAGEQRLVLSQKQRLAVMLMPLASSSVREHILSEAEENPAISIPAEWKNDIPEVFPCPDSSKSIPFFFERYSTRHSAAGAESADNHQTLIEQTAVSQTLQQHLLEQVGLIKQDDRVIRACRVIIRNLNDRGFHIVPLNQLPGVENPEVREKALFIVRNLEPEGLACTDVWESLAFQASISTRNVPRYTDVVLMKYHDLLRRHRPELLARNLKKHGIVITENYARLIMDFIATLNPNPAAMFGSGHRYVEPDAYVEVTDGKLSVRLARVHIPALTIDQSYADRSRVAGVTAEEKRQIRENVKKAKLLADSLSMVSNSLQRITEQLVSIQSDYFLQKDGPLKAVTQAALAHQLGLSKSTVSRVVSGKYLMSPRGFMALSALFSVPVSIDGQTVFSRDKVQKAISEIVAASSEKLSDREITEELQRQGIVIARRTVTKYRTLMNMGSSFDLER